MERALGTIGNGESQLDVSNRDFFVAPVLTTARRLGAREPFIANGWLPIPRQNGAWQMILASTIRSDQSTGSFLVPLQRIL